MDLKGEKKTRSNVRCTSLARWPSPSRSDRPRSPLEPACPGSREPPAPVGRRSCEYVHLNALRFNSFISVVKDKHILSF